MKRLVLGILLLSNLAIANDWYITMVKDGNVVDCVKNNTANPSEHQGKAKKLDSGIYVIDFGFELYVASSKVKCEKVNGMLKKLESEK